MTVLGHEHFSNFVRLYYVKFEIVDVETMVKEVADHQDILRYYLPTYLLICLHTNKSKYLLINLLTITQPIYLHSTYIPTFLPFIPTLSNYLPTYFHAYLHTYLPYHPIYLPYQPIYLPIPTLPNNLPTLQPTHLSRSLGRSLMTKVLTKKTISKLTKDR